MHEYNFTIEYIQNLTIEQIFLFKEKIDDRLENKAKFDAKIHGASTKNQGLDTDGAIPIENLIDSGAKLF